MQEIGHQHEVAPGVGVGGCPARSLSGNSSGTVQITGSSQGLRSGWGESHRCQRMTQPSRPKKPTRVSRRAKRVLADLQHLLGRTADAGLTVLDHDGPLDELGILVHGANEVITVHLAKTQLLVEIFLGAHQLTRIAEPQLTQQGADLFSLGACSR